MGRVSGWSHVEVTVASLERSVAYYRDLLGLEPAGEWESQGEKSSKLNGIPNTHMKGAIMRIPDGVGPVLELIEWVSPKGVPTRGPMNESGRGHLAFTVSNLGETCERLRAQGFEVVSEPVAMDGGTRLVFVRDPDGYPIELVEG